MPRHEVVVRSSKKLHNAYWSMIYRCYDPSDNRYYTYGARGVGVCDRWRGKYGKQHFLQDMGEPESWQSIDRIDNDKDYSPENCRWIDKKLQMQKRTNTRWINGLCMNEACRRAGISRQNVYRYAKRKGIDLQTSFNAILARKKTV